jgi:hypothetical protein
MITKALDLEKLSPEEKAKIRVICSQDPTDEKLEALADELEITHLFPERKAGNGLRIWLKVLGYIKPKDSDSGDIPIIAWIDMQAESYLDGNPNQDGRGEEIANTLELRLSVISDVFLKSNDLLERVKEKNKSEIASD